MSFVLALKSPKIRQSPNLSYSAHSSRSTSKFNERPLLNQRVRKRNLYKANYQIFGKIITLSNLHQTLYGLCDRMLNLSTALRTKTEIPPDDLPRLGSIIVWRLGGFGLILDAEFGFRKIISAVYGFFIVTRLRKIGM